MCGLHPTVQRPHVATPYLRERPTHERNLHLLLSASGGASFHHFRRCPTQKQPASNFCPSSWKWRTEARNGCVALSLESVELQASLSCRGRRGVGSWVSKTRKLRASSRSGGCTRWLGGSHHGEEVASGARDLGRQRWRGLGAQERWG